MMKHYLTAFVLAGSFAAAQANACDYPAKPGKLPDGNSASKDEMLAAKKLVTTYTDEIKAYLDCLDKDTTEKLAAMLNATEKEKAEVQKKTDKKHDAAVTEMMSVTDGFNEQIRAWKAKSATEKPAS